MGLLEVAVLGVDGDVAAEEEEDTQLELRAEGGGEPDSVGLWRVDDAETEARDISAEQRADGEGDLARHGGADDDGLKRGGVDVGVALPSKVVLHFRTEVDVEDVATVDAFLTDEVEEVPSLDL